MPETHATAPEALDPLLDRAASLADVAAHWETLADKPGTVVDAHVERVDAAGVTLRLASGLTCVPADALGGTTALAGQTVRVFVEQVLVDGPRVSRAKAQALDAWDALDEAARLERPVTGRVLARVQGGLSVAVSVGDAPALKAFLPEKRHDAPLGASASFFVREWDERRDLFVLSREAGSQREARKARREARAVEADAEAAAPKQPVTLPEVGAELDGVVARLAAFGAFVDLPGGATGLLHAKEMSHGRDTQPADIVRVGETLKVKVLSVEGERVALTRKPFLSDPWAGLTDRYSVGQRVSGKVIGFSEAGAFVEVEAGLEAFIHVSELRWGASPKHPKDALRAGESVQAEVIVVDAAKRHLKLSVRKVQPAPVDALRARFPVGAKVTGRVKNVASFGVFVVLDEASGLEGLVHNSDLSWLSGARASSLVTVGAELEVLVLGVDEERGRAMLGVKQLQPEPTLPSLEAFAVGAALVGKVARVKDFGAFIELAPGVEGLLHANAMGLAEGEKPKARFNSGDDVRVVVSSLDVASRKIGLTLAPTEGGSPAT
jgi:small subunit ribosomal protein S1